MSEQGRVLSTENKAIEDILLSKTKKGVAVGESVLTSRVEIVETTEPDPEPNTETKFDSIGGDPKKKKKQLTWHNEVEKSIDAKSQVIIMNENNNKKRRRSSFGDTRNDSWCRRQWTEADSTLRRSLSVWLLVIYAFAGSGIFYAIEKDNLAKGYWDALSYVNSLYTTIGYGNIAPNTTEGRVFTIVYTSIGVPLFLTAASDLGLVLVYLTGLGWLYFRRLKKHVTHHCCVKLRLRHRRVSVAIQKNDDFRRAMAKEKNIPISVAACCFVFWLMISILYFYVVEKDTEPKWDFFMTLYFFFISITTVGLGDINVTDTSRTIFDYFFVICGLALFSFLIRLFSKRLSSIDEEVIDMIMTKYRSTLREKYEAFEGGDVRMEANERKQRIVIRKLIREKGGWLRFFIGRDVETKMLQQYQSRANMRLESTQTTINVRNVGLDVKPMLVDVQTMAGDSFIGKQPTDTNPYHNPNHDHNHEPVASLARTEAPMGAGANANANRRVVRGGRRVGRGRGFFGRSQRGNRAG